VAYAASSGDGALAMIHASPSVVAPWDAEDLLEKDAFAGGPDGQGAERWRTHARGDFVVAGSGYPTSQGPTGEPAPPDGAEWAFVTGLVYGRLGPTEVPSDFYESVDRSNNTYRMRAYRSVAMVHDGCLTPGAVMVDTTGGGVIDGGDA